MQQDMFSDFSIINIDRSISNNISADDILNEFAKKDHRLQF